MTAPHSDYLHLEYFEKDRNVILKTSQQSLFNFLAGYLVKVAIDQYKVLFNPLGLVDDTFQKILDYQFENTEVLREVYENLSVMYRYKHGDNQLEIIWDGTTHEEKYAADWTDTFEHWIKELTNNQFFTKAVLQLTVFNDKKSNTFFIQNSVKGMINDYFEVKILKRNGVKKVVIKNRMLKIAS